MAGQPLMQTKHKIPQDWKLFLVSPCRWKTKEVENSSTQDTPVLGKTEACALYLLSKERTVTKKIYIVSYLMRCPRYLLCDAAGIIPEQYILCWEIFTDEVAI